MSPELRIDSDRIFNAITSSGLPPAAIEQGSELVDAWVAECALEDQRYKTLLLEAGFFIELDSRTFVVGAMDKVMRDEVRVLAQEQKSTSSSKTWTCERWLDSLIATHQVGTYAAGLKYGKFPVGLEAAQRLGARPEDTGGLWEPSVSEPRLLLRAVTKSKPPEIWPSPAGALVSIDDARIEHTLNTYRNVAAAIRGMRRTGALPWAVPAKHCEKAYGYKTYVCEFHHECSEGIYPSMPFKNENVGLSPGSENVLKFLLDTGRVREDNDYVVLSSSSLDDFFQCSERWRRRSLGQPREEKDSLDIGSVLHTGLLSYHQQCQEQGF